MGLCETYYFYKMVWSTLAKNHRLRLGLVGIRLGQARLELHMDKDSPGRLKNGPHKAWHTVLTRY